MQELNPEAVAEPTGDGHQRIESQPSDIGIDSMEIGDGNATVREPIETFSGSVAQASGPVDRESTGLVNSSSTPSQAESSDRSPGPNSQSSCHAISVSEPDMAGPGTHASPVPESADVDMNANEVERDPVGSGLPQSGVNLEEPSAQQNSLVVQDAASADESSLNNEASNANGIDPTFLEALPEDLRAEVLASQQAQSAPPPPTYAPPRVEDIDPEFLAALPPDIQAEVLAQQRAQRIAQQSEGQPVDMDNASIIATFPADLREEVCFSGSEATNNLSASLSVNLLPLFVYARCF